MDEVRERPLTQRLLAEKGYYVSDNEHVLKDNYLPDRFRYESDISQRPLDAADVHALRYVQMASYLDARIATRMAQLFAEKGVFANVKTDKREIETSLRKLADIGLLIRRQWLDKNKDFAPDGRIIQRKGIPAFYCLSAYGVKYYRDTSENDEYIEDFLLQKTSCEVMRRLAANYCVLVCASVAGSYRLNYTSKLDGIERLPIYGRIENRTGTEVAYFEPAFLDYDETVETKEEFEAHLKLRNRFLAKKAAEKRGKNMSLVLVVTDTSALPAVYMAYETARKAFSHVYITSEKLLFAADNDELTYSDAFITPVVKDGRLILQKTPPVFLN